MNWIGGARKRMQHLKKSCLNPANKPLRDLQFISENKKKQLHQLTNDEGLSQNNNLPNHSQLNIIGHQENLMNSMAIVGFQPAERQAKNPSSAVRQRLNLFGGLKHSDSQSQSYEQIVFE